MPKATVSVLLFLTIALLAIEGKIVFDNFSLFFPKGNSWHFSEAAFSQIPLESNMGAMVLLEERYAEVLPQRRWSIPEFKPQATSVLAYDLTRNKLLYGHNDGKTLPIASITKLMTGLLVKEHEGKLNDWLQFQPEDLKIEGHRNLFLAGERFKKEDLLSASLIGSNNEATVLLARNIEKALSQKGSPVRFVDLMNVKARQIGMRQTHFSNPIGFDGNNFSTAKDLVKLVKYILKEQRDLFEPTILRQKTIYSKKGRPCLIVNTDALAGELPGLAGSKTGYTDLAKGCLLIIKDFGKDRVLLIVLGSKDRIGEMKRLINWVANAYSFFS